MNPHAVRHEFLKLAWLPLHHWPINWCCKMASIHPPPLYQSGALPNELLQRVGFICLSGKGYSAKSNQNLSSLTHQAHKTNLQITSRRMLTPRVSCSAFAATLWAGVGRTLTCLNAYYQQTERPNVCLSFASSLMAPP